MKITFDFEKPLADLQAQIDKVKQVEEKTKVDMSATINELQEKFDTTKTQIYTHLSGWQRVQISRHPERPYVEMKDASQLYALIDAMMKE